MAIGDSRRHDAQDLTTEHLARVAKAKEKLAVQMRAIVKACDQAKKVAESRDTYLATSDMWERVLGDARKELDDLEMVVRRAEERRARGTRRWEW